MHHEKNRGNKEIPLAILSRILAQSCVTICLNYVGRVTHDCATILSCVHLMRNWDVVSVAYIQLNKKGLS